MASEKHLTRYRGSELPLFAQATHWGEYLKAQVTPYVRGTVIEVGAGAGTRTRSLRSLAQRWVAVEPDAAMASALCEMFRGDAGAEVVHGTLDDVPSDVHADCVLYLDVLEHIEADADEIQLASRRLTAQGHLVVLAPAHAWLYTPFDATIGHFRRYSRSSLRKLAGPELRATRCRMLDSVGMLASIGNRFILRSGLPTPEHIRLWDSLMVPLSRLLDPVLGFSVGNSILMVWARSPRAPT